MSLGLVTLEEAGQLVVEGPVNRTAILNVSSYVCMREKMCVCVCVCVCVCLLESSWLIDYKHKYIITLIITPTCMCIPIHTCGGAMLQSPINDGIPAPNIAVGP